MGAAGSATEDFEMVIRPDPPPGTTIADMTFSYEGTITY